MQMMAKKERRKDVAMKEKEAWKLEVDRKSMERLALKSRREAEKVQKAADAEALKAFKVQ
jgi:hypothetical protein